MPDPEAPPPLATGQIEIWKKIVDVQQHFNDLELRIRNFALVVTGAFLGLGGYAIKDGGIINVFGLDVSIAGLVVFSAVVPLFSFYFMDRLWYHRLLEGSVKAGIKAESALTKLGYTVDLGSEISEHSPFILWLTNKKIHSKTKMDMFYSMLVVALLIVAVCLGFGIRPRPEPVPTPATAVGSAPATVTSNAAEPPIPAVAAQALPAPPAAATTANTMEPVSNSGASKARP